MKNIRKEIIGVLLVSTLFSGCQKKDNNYLSDVLNNYKDTTFVDEYLMEDNITKNNISKLEKDIDKYFEYSSVSKKIELEEKIESYGMESVYDLLNYTLISEVCDNLKLSKDDDHNFSAKYLNVLKDDEESISLYLLTFDDNTLYVYNLDDNKCFDLIRYIAIFNSINIQGYDNTVNIFKDAIDTCKEVISRDTMININNEFYTKNKVKSLKK